MNNRVKVNLNAQVPFVEGEEEEKNPVDSPDF